MSELLVGLFSAVIGNKVIMAILAAVVGGVSLFVAGGIRRANKDIAKQAARDLAAAQDSLEMNREATAAERQAAGMTDDQARSEATKWAKH
ncbi:MAG: hypothetical protein EOQ39_22355 [Mesorhizobium sp.]|uniref:hypothetical protein n=1 Tax=Mesorhizobium sp. TaxID=1871066 RepID=UPI000FE57705|nr:hypothetical protein [Mesorhizobium sp.]RWB05478.1 MAG: hypothetical protein EOQ37_14555 [Mesorhizobium sp.]RWB12551.1 MAG: hypothetical protein EOQ39_22355 [Mesorhizobium sp.]